MRHEHTRMYRYTHTHSALDTLFCYFARGVGTWAYLSTVDPGGIVKKFCSQIPQDSNEPKFCLTQE